MGNKISQTQSVLLAQKSMRLIAQSRPMLMPPLPAGFYFVVDYQGKYVVDHEEKYVIAKNE